MGELVSAQLMDTTFSNASGAIRSGYIFTVGPVTGKETSQYNATAVATTPGTAGNRAFATLESGVIYGTVGGTAATAAPTVSHTDGSSADGTPIG